MAGKRINSAAPLSDAEKQKRHRQKKIDEKNAAYEEQTNRLRELFIKEIQELSPDELIELIKRKDNPLKFPETVTMKEFCKLAGITEYEFKKLERQGVIEPIKENPYGLTDDEISGIEKTGLTVNEFMRLLQFTDQLISLPELSEKANIPLRKLERLESEGLFQTA
jgi:DNA-binding transcriptional MerR regulator